MITYSLNSKLTFGKYEDYTVESVLQFDANYIEWCILNLDGINFTKSVIEEMEKHIHVFQTIKDTVYEKSRNEIVKEQSYYEDYDASDYYNNYSDEDIFNDAFEGDIDA